MKAIRKGNYIISCDKAGHEKDFSILSITRKNFNGTFSIVHNEFIDKEFEGNIEQFAQQRFDQLKEQGIIKD